jgi:hypothetical protein
MKKYLKLLSLLVTVLLVTSSCDKKDELIIFDNINGQTMIQFSKTSATLPTPSEGASFEVSVLVTTVSDVDREIDIEIVPQTDPDKTSASPDQYTISNLVIPAGSYSGTITISSNFDAIPEEGSTFLTLKLTGLAGASTTIYNGILEVELFRKCPIVAGDYTFRLVDVYGDGWQGSHLTVTIDGVSQEIALTSYWDTDQSYYGPEFYDFTYTVTVPEGTKTLTFSYTAGDYPEETYYEIYSPNDILIYADGNPNDYVDPPVEGEISWNPCNS